MRLHEWVKKVKRKRIYIIGTAAAVVFAAGAAWHATSRPMPAFAMSEEYIAAVGPLEAQEVALQHSKQGDTTVNGHMFFHLVGGYLFKTYGVEGVTYCKPYFDHGCYNGFMMEISSATTTEAALAACNAINYYTLNGCIHGAGHAALMLSNNDVPKALELCSNFEKPFGTSTLEACSFGVFMANAEPTAMGAMQMDMDMPGMNMADMQTASARWALKQDDPSFPCDDPRIEQQYRSGCWRMQTVILVNKLPASQIIELCNGLSDDEQKKYCLYGFADGYATLPTVSTDDIISLCNLVSDGWKDTCLLNFVQRAYLNGFDSRIPDTICTYMDTGGKTSCAQMRTKMENTLAQ